MIKDINELEIYQLSLKASVEIASFIKSIPYYWNIPESNQIIRSSSSIHSNIAEGFGHRFYPRQFIRYLSIAIGSSDESRNHIYKLTSCGYIKDSEAEKFAKSFKNISVKITNLVNYLRKRYNINTISN